MDARAVGGEQTVIDQIEPRSKACILIWLDGGPSHLETFDLKPDAPEEVRGPFRPTPTNVPGIAISEYMPATAKLMDKIALIRSMTSTLGEHNFCQPLLVDRLQADTRVGLSGMPSVVTYCSGNTTAIPANVALQRPNGMSGPGYLSERFSPFVIQGDPSKPDFRVQDLDAPAELSSIRHHRRRRLREAVDEFARGYELAAEKAAPTSFDKAYDLIASTRARQAFDLSREKPALRSKYGRHTLGQSCLMARRLIEAGTKFVTVTDRGWDTHEQLYTRLKEGFTGGSVGKIPKLDTAYSALISDLHDRGLLESTMVILMGEFGRTPKLNPRGGRDHWPRAFSVALAGGGVPGGQVIGASDAHGERPADRPVTPADLARTIYTQIGIDPDRHLMTADGRPVQINRDGTPINELLS